MEQHYLLHIYAGTDIELRGPYEEVECLEEAKRMFQEEVDEEDSLFWLTQDADGHLSATSFSQDFVESALNELEDSEG